MAKKHPIEGFWKRTWFMRNRFNMLGKFTGYPLLAIFVILGHIAFATMHYLYIMYMKITSSGE